MHNPTPTPRYRFGFLARYLRPLVFEARVSRGYRQYEVAEWLEIPGHALSEYLTCRSHPTEERERKLLRLGCDVRRMRRAILADKLSFWMEKMELTVDDLGGAVRRVDAEVHQSAEKLLVERPAVPGGHGRSNGEIRGN